MMRVYWHIAGRFCEVRANRALQKYLDLKKRAEDFFQKIEGGR